MNFKVYDHSTNYTCTVVKLPVKQKVDGLDNLVKVEIFGNSCLVGKDSNPEDLYLFFPAESQLSEIFLKQNNLYREIQLNADDTKKGFFEATGRVKTVKFKGVISSGFVTPISSLIGVVGDEQYVLSKLKAGDDFNEIDGVEVCRKYVPKNAQTPGAPGSKSTKQDKTNNKLKDLVIPNQLRFHDETGHLAKNLHVFSPEDIVLISDKWHGSSCILAKVFINKPLKWYEKLANKLGANINNREIGYIFSSGKPKSLVPKGVLHLDETEKFRSNTGDFYSSNIWKKAFDDYKHALEDGISVYGELVGYTEGGSYIQKGFDYGCQPGQYKLVVYRITYTKPDGSVIEFSWQQIKDYCAKYEMETVKEFYFGRLKDWAPELANSENFMEAVFEKLQTSYNMERVDQYCASKVPAEGLVVRKDGKTTYSAYKLKSKKFLANESAELDSGNVSVEDQP